MDPAKLEQQEADPAIRSMVEAIVEEVDPLQIILFGSRARGEAGPDSDVDLLVVEEGPFGLQKSRRREAARLYRRLAGAGVAKDIVLATRAELEQWRGSVNHVVARALRKGRVLYERP